jgi:phage protein D
MHAYVWPGDNPGDSVGCFRDFPTSPEGLPPLVLLGNERNIETFNVRNNAQNPSDVQASTMRFSDRSIVSRTVRHRDVELMGKESAIESVQEPATQVLAPRQGGTMDLRQAATAQAQRTSYAYEATGKVRTECYGDILRPYQMVTVQAGNIPQSGNYIIFKVEHNLTRSIYSQSFSLKSDAKSQRHGPSSSVPGRKVT